MDALNIDFVAVGGTATTVAGAMILACRSLPGAHLHSTLVDEVLRWGH